MTLRTRQRTLQMQPVIKITEGAAVYETSATNASIAASASESFLISTIDQEGKLQWGSFSYLEIVNDDVQTLDIDLDNLSTRRRRLFGKSTLVIKPSEGIFFNTLKITNTSSTTAVGAANIKIIARIVR